MDSTTPAPENRRLLLNILWRLITPRTVFPRPEEQRQARIYLVVLIFMILVGLLLLVGRMMVGLTSEILIAALICLVIIYAIGRFLSFTISKYLLLALFTLQIPILYTTGFYSPLAYLLVVFTVLLSALLTGSRLTLLTASVNMTVLTSLSLLFPSPNSELATATLTMLVTAGLVCGLMSVLAFMREADTSHLHRQAAALRESEERFRLLLESSPEMIAVQSGSKFLYINATGVRMLGAKTAAEITAGDVRQFMMESGRGHLSSRLKRTGSEETLTVSFDQTFRRLDDRFIKTQVTASSITYQGQMATLLIVREVGDTLATRPGLETSFERTLNTIPVCLFITAGEKLLFANRQVEVMTGYRQAELNDIPLSRLMEENTLNTLPGEALTYHERVVRFSHRTGQVFYGLLRSQSIEYQGQPAFFHTAYDITRFWQQSQQLSLLQTAVDQQQEAILITDASVDVGGVIVYVNPAFCQMSGYEAEDIIGKTPRFLQGPLTNRQMLLALRRALESGQPFSGENINYRQDGSPYTVQWNISPLRNPDGVITHFISTQRDISEQRRLLDNLREQEERYRSVTELMSDYVFAMDVLPDLRTRGIWITGAVEAMTGYTVEEILGLRSWEETIYEEDLPFARQTFYKLLEGKPAQIELRVKSKITPPYCRVQYALRPVRDEAQQRVVRIYGAAHSIHDRVKAEEALKAHLIQQAIVVELGLLALSESRVPALLEHSVVLCEQVLSASLCEIVSYNPDNQTLQLSASTGEGEKLTWSAENSASGAGYALSRRESVTSANLTTETRFRSPAYLLEKGLTASLSVLIHGSPYPFGVLSIYSRESRTFTDDDSYFLQSVANILGAALERSRALAAEREQREFTEALHEITAILNSKFDLGRVLDTVLEFAAQVIPGHEASTIWLLEADGNTLRFACSRGYESIKDEFPSIFYKVAELPVAHRMIATRQPVLINHTLESDLWTMPENATWIRSYVGAPIILDEEFIGFINVDSSRPGAFSGEDARRLLTFAGKAATAIRNASRAEDLERRVIERTRELSIRSEQLQAILDSTGEGILYTEDVEIVFANRALCALTGYAADEIRQSTLYRLFMPDDATPQEIEVVRSITETVRTGTTWRNEIRLRRKDGSTFDAGLTIARVGEAGEPLLRAVTVVRDIRREKELEQQKTRFIANAAHELRSPITNLNTRLYLMKRQPEHIAEHIALLERVGIRMNRLVSDLLDLSYFEHGQILLQTQDVILQEIVLEVVEMQRPEAAGKQIELHHDLPAAPIHLLADPHRLNQVFTNLVINAIACTPEQGHIHISASLDEAVGQAVVCVQDSGSGIPPESMAHIFQPFFRLERKYPGTGLGLSIAREIVELHGGTISVENVSESGALFKVQLNALPQEPV